MRRTGTRKKTDLRWSLKDTLKWWKIEPSSYQIRNVSLTHTRAHTHIHNNRLKSIGAIYPGFRNRFYYYAPSIRWQAFRNFPVTRKYIYIYKSIYKQSHQNSLPACNIIRIGTCLPLIPQPTAGVLRNVIRFGMDVRLDRHQWTSKKAIVIPTWLAARNAPYSFRCSHQ